jgi:2-dehydro-3-deoxyphosphooctonate aldolase (KDO 8-P synthase)
LSLVREVEIGGRGTAAIRIGGGRPLAWIAGPCVIEDRDTMATTAAALKELSQRLGIPLIFKSSFEKDNRSSELFESGPGVEEGLEILAWIRKEFELPVLSDVHRVEDIAAAREVLDVIQIPAFLSRQTSLLVAAGQAAGAAGCAVNVKKGQFLAPDEMGGVVGKLERSGCSRILLTERGACFGYKQLVADMTALPIMQRFGYPVVFDAGHQVRRSGIPSSDPAGGAPEFIPTLMRAAVAAGANCVFLETHPNPPEALCDAASQYPLSRMEKLMIEIGAIAELTREQGYA